MELAIEVFEQGQRRSFVIHSTQEVVRIGRGWNNEVIVRDPLVDAEHLEIHIDESGSIKIKDLQSLNGTRVQGKALSENTELQFGVPIRIGHSNIVVHRSNEVVAQAEPIPQFESIIEKMQQPLIAIVCLFVVLLIAYLSGQFTSDISSESDERFGAAMLFGLSLILWSSIWGVVARLLRHEMAFWGHLSLISLVCSLILAADVLIDWTSFNLLSLTLNNYGYSAIFSLALLLWIFIGLDMSTRLKPRKRATISVAITGSVSYTHLTLPTTPYV